MARRPLEQVLKEHADRLISLPGVVGVAQSPAGSGPCILVMIAAKSAELLRSIPATIEGYPVHVEETGEFHAS